MYYLAASQHACAGVVLYVSQQNRKYIRSVLHSIVREICCPAPGELALLSSKEGARAFQTVRTVVQALKDAGCDEVVLAINYQPKASTFPSPAAQILYHWAARPFA